MVDFRRSSHIYIEISKENFYGLLKIHENRCESYHSDVKISNRYVASYMLWVLVHHIHNSFYLQEIRIHSLALLICMLFWTKLVATVL